MTGSQIQPVADRCAPEVAPASTRLLENLLIACSLAGVAAFITVGLHRSVWLDEANCILISSLPFTGIIDGLRHDNNFPLYYFLLAGWMRLFGNSEAALRALSAIFYVCGGLAAFALAKLVCGNKRSAGYAAFFYVASALAVRQAQNIRMYSLLGMLAGLSTLAYVRLFFQADRSWRSKVFFVLINAAGILTHAWFAFILVAQFVALVMFEAKQVRAWIAWVAVAALPFLLFWSPRFLDQVRNGATSWMPTLEPGAVIVAPLEFYGFLPGMLLYGLAGGLWLTSDAEKRKGLLPGKLLPAMFTLFVISLALPLLVSMARPIYAPGRYVIIALAPLTVLLGAVLSSLLPRPVLPVLGILLLAAGVTQQIAHRDEVPESDLPPGQSDRVTAQFLLEHAAPGDAVVFTSLTRAAADYYFLRSHAGARFLEISFPEETVTHLGWLDPRVPPDRHGRLEAEAERTARRLRELAANGHRVWFYSGGAPAVTSILQQKLESALAHPHEYSLWGPYHRKLLEFPGLTAPVPF